MMMHWAFCASSADDGLDSLSCPHGRGRTEGHETDEENKEKEMDIEYKEPGRKRRSHPVGREVTVRGPWKEHTDMTAVTYSCSECT